jgi:hypothetical protein
VALRAKKPETKDKRLKLFMFGEAGVGKTTAACQMPKPYIIDAERGTDNYAAVIDKAKGVVLQTVDMDSSFSLIHSLSVDSHDYRTIVIDPITPLYADLLVKAEQRVGTDWGRHYGEANKTMRRVVNLLMRLDMNVVMTAHAKAVYGDDMKRTGYTFDGWKRLDYIFDLVLELRRQGPKRYARIAKTRISSFPDGESFEWSYTTLTERYDPKVMERSAKTIVLADEDIIDRIVKLADRLNGGEEFIEKCKRKASVASLNDLTEDQATAMVANLTKKLGG